jgi:hypothetical protein
LAKAAMSAEESTSPDDQAEAPTEDNAQPTQTIVDDNLIGRTLTVTVVAIDRNKATAHRSAIIELTGAKAQPYWVRYVE